MDKEKLCKKLCVSCNIFQEQLTHYNLEFCNDNKKEVSPLPNWAAQDLLLLKEPLLTVVAGENEDENTNELLMEMNF